MIRSSLVACALVLAACVPVQSAPLPDAEASTMCAHLAALGCAEGQDTACPTTIAKVRAARLIRIDPVCVMQATDRSSVRLCPAIQCPEVAP